MTTAPKIEHSYRETNNNGLGYFHCVVFDVPTGISAEEILNNKLLADLYAFTSQKDQLKKSDLIILAEEFGPIDINKLEVHDFSKISFETLCREIEKFENEDFSPALVEQLKLNFEKAIKLLEDYSIEDRSFFYLNIENVRPEILHCDWFSYFMGLFSIENNKLVVVSFGLD